MTPPDLETVCAGKQDVHRWSGQAVFPETLGWSAQEGSTKYLRQQVFHTFMAVFQLDVFW